MYQKNFNFDIFFHENFHFSPWTAGLAKITAHRVLFLVSMDSQRSKKFDGSHFWPLGCLLTASGWLESIQAIMAPPPSSNVIPEPVQNRVKKSAVICHFFLLFCSFPGPSLSRRLYKVLLKRLKNETNFGLKLPKI